MMLIPILNLPFEITTGTVVFWLVRSAVFLGFFFLARQKVLLALLVWLVASPAGSYWVPGYRGVDIGIIAVVFLLQQSRTGEKLRIRSPLELLLGLFAAVLVLHLVWFSRDPHAGFRVLVEAFILPFGTYLIGRELVDQREFEGSVRPALQVLGLLLAACAVTEQVAKVDLLPGMQNLRIIYPGSTWLRVNGPYSDDATLTLIATMLLFALFPTAPAASAEARTGRRLASGIAFLLLATTVLVTFYRIFWAILVLGLVVFLLATGMRHLRRILILAAILIMIAVAVAYKHEGLREFYRERIVNPSNLYYRLATYRMAWEMVQEDPWFGVGFGNFSQAIQERPAKPFRGHRPLDHPHSGYFLLLGEIGWPGFALYSAVLVCLLWPGIRLLRAPTLRSTALGLTLSLGSYLVVNLVLTLFTIPAINQLLFLFGGILSSLSRHYQLQGDSAANQQPNLLS